MTADTLLEPELLDRVGRLDKNQRDALIDVLIEQDEDAPTDESEYRAYWKAELARRWNRYKSGGESPESPDEVIASLRRQRRAPSR